MKVLSLQTKEEDGFEVKALIGNKELLELAGHTEGLAIFPAERVTRPTQILNDGDEARYVKMPGWVRATEDIKYTTLKYREHLYIIYRVPPLEKKRLMKW